MNTMNPQMALQRGVSGGPPVPSEPGLGMGGVALAGTGGPPIPPFMGKPERAGTPVLPGGNLGFFAWVCLFALLLGARSGAAVPLVSLDYRITGTQLRVSPSILSVPKGVAGSVSVQITTGTSTNDPAVLALAEGAYVEATLRGPGLPEARRLVGAPNAALLLPPLNLVGDYQLDNVRLVDAVSGVIRLEGQPSSVPVRVFDEVLVSKVTSRPLTTDEIQEKGIVIDEQNFRAVEFEVGFVLDGKTIPVRFPVVSPRFTGNSEIIPAAELEKRLAEAALINQQIASDAQLPPELEASQLNLQVQGINFQRADVADADGLGLTIPPIPALVVIPGNIGFLNQFFSVQIFTENASPAGSGLSAFNIEARLFLPPGPDRVVSTDYSQPGDDPLRFARIGSGAVVQPVQPVVRPGPDGKPGTADDIGRLFPGEGGQGEFLVEGLQEGLHVMDIELTADLDGLAAGTVRIKGKAAGSVLVRNPKFSLAFTHPRTIRTGEPYEASVTVLNTGSTPANLVSVTLPSASLSGGVLETSDTVQLGTILPGQTATATYRVRAQRTGAISFSNLTTGDDGVQGRFRLTMGIDERGVVLSPDTLAMPDYATNLPPALLSAAIRVLGQGLSVATAAQLPPGVIPVSRSILTTRVLELAEAGQRLAYGESLDRVLVDLLLDWQGGRSFNAGFDQILRATNAGREWREAVAHELAAADGVDAVARLARRSPDLAGRGEAWRVAAANTGSIQVGFGGGARVAEVLSSGETQSLVYAGQRGVWAVFPGGRSAEVQWRFTEEVAQAEVSLVDVGTNGLGRTLRWQLDAPSTNACYRFVTGGASDALIVDLDCNGESDASIAATIVPLQESAPSVLAVLQDLTVLSGRPGATCLPAPGRNYGTVIAVLFSKSMTQDQVDVPTAYQLDNGNVAGSVQIQPGGRVALLNMRQTVGAIRPRSLIVRGVTDVRGNELLSAPVPVANGASQGVAIRGRVVRADGSPAIAVPVTLTEHDLKFDTGFSSSCEAWIQRPAQVFTDGNGFFEFDYVMSGIPYSISATDTAGLAPEAIQLLIDAAVGDAATANRLRERAESSGQAGFLAAAFGTGTVTEAIARAEGLDRAVLRDLVPMGSSREGTQVFVALRFRGRGTVAGTVLAPDGVTPVSQVAVNLFPDPDSRELGRGVFSDANGRFVFQGVPLGVFTVSAAAASGAQRTVAGLIDAVGQVKEIPIVLGTQVIERGTLAGQVFETDNATPHASGRVFVGRYESGRFGNVIAVAEGDESGLWVASGIPVGTYDVVAISSDGRRTGERRGVQVAAGSTRHVSIALQGRATVIGRVESALGQPVANALVAGGEGVVRTDASGTFSLPGVPTGARTISAGVERTTDPGNPKSSPAFDFPRLGSAPVNVVAGIDNYVVIRLGSMGRITGRVLNVLGQPEPNVRVAIPQENGFIWVDADAAGNYRFEGLGLGGYQISAPAPGTAATSTSGLIAQIREGSEEEIQAAIGEAFRIFTGVSDPYLNGATFNPATWGFTSTSLTFDGQTVVADIRYRREGSVSGRVLNAQGVPIGARVRLTGIGPLANGASSFVVRGEVNSDPALGTFEFPGALLAGSWGIQVASPFYPSVLSASGVTTQLDPDATNIVLQFPPVAEVNGRLVGRVLQPDGSPVGANVNVRISFGDDYIVRTRTNGTFDTQIALPARAYTVQAEDPVTGLKGVAGVSVQPGVTNSVEVRLLGKGSLRVAVQFAGGAPAPGASVEVVLGGYPGDRLTGTTGGDGTLHLENLFEGGYAVCGSAVSGPSQIKGRSGVTVVRDQQASVVVTLAPTATLRGTFVKRDRVTPIGFAQIAVGSIGFAATDPQGFFEIVGIPLGTYRLVSQDPVTGAGATTSVTLAVNGEVRTVQLIEQSRGEVVGRVIGSYGTNFVAGASVTVQAHDGLTPARSVTSGPDGSFSFPGTPAGPFTLSARDPVSGLTGSASATLPVNAASIQLDVPIQPLGALAVTVVRPADSTPASPAAVQISGPRTLSTDVDAGGQALFTDLPLGSYHVRVTSLVLVENRSIGTASAQVSRAGAVVPVAVRLDGVGSIAGQVFQSDGTTSAPGIEVRLVSQSPSFNGLTLPTLTDAQGRYDFDNVPIGAFSVAATAQSLGSTASGRLQADGQSVTVDLVLGSSGVVNGRLVRADGTNAVAGVDVLLSFRSQTGLPGLAQVRTDAQGAFQFRSIPVGAFFLESIGAGFGGIARIESSLLGNGETNALGDVRFDEDDPRVVAVSPADSATGIPTTSVVDLWFNEALDPISLNPRGVYLRSSTQTVPAAVTLLADPTNGVLRRVRLAPSGPLQSEVTYEVIVIDGERLDATGGVIATGPRDRVGRPLVVPFLSRFTTSDDAPPQLVSLFPTNGAVQLDPRTILRWSFNEPLRATSPSVVVSGPAGPIAGLTSVGVNGLVVNFTPDAALPANQQFTVTLSDVFDLAGNRATGEPFISHFSTLDTVGPTIAALRVVDGRPPIAGSTLAVEALLVAEEPGAGVRFSRDFIPAGSLAAAPFRIDVSLPSSGATTVRAIATDRYGNEGPVAELVLQTQANQPPEVSLVRVDAPGTTLTNGQPFTIRVAATDDLAVTNLVLVGVGPISFATNLVHGGAREFSFIVPTEAPAGTSYRFLARAIDAQGLDSFEATLELVVEDTRAPSLAFENPAAGALLTGPIFLISADNSLRHTLELRLSGALVSTQSLVVVGTPGTSVTNGFPVDLAAAPVGGGEVIATALATDDRTNTTQLVRSFRLPDLRAPRLTSVTPTNTAPRQSLWSSLIAFNFDEALDPTTVLASRVSLTNASGSVVPFTLELGEVGRQIQVRPARPLTPGTTYTATLLPGFADGTGNVWQTATGQPVPPEGWATRFTTAALVDVSPTNGFVVMSGQSLAVRVDFEEGVGATRFRFALGDAPPTEVVAGVTRASTTLTVPAVATAGPLTLSLVAGPDAAFSQPFTLTPVVLQVVPATGDFDGDGLPDGFELANGLDPLRNDAALDPDLDGLTHGQEFLVGSDPFLSDTDGDTLKDGAEVALGTSAILRDTDGDGLEDNIDPRPLIVDGGVTVEGLAQVNLMEGDSIELVFLSTASEAPVTRVEIADAITGPAFLSSRSIRMTNSPTGGTAAYTIAVNPLHDAAGVHRFTVRAIAANGESGTLEVTLNIADNPALTESRWVSGVSGSWTDAANWSAGVPGPGQVAVIDAPGAYTVRVAGTTVAAAGVVLAQASAEFSIAGAVFDAPVEIRNGGVVVENHQTLTIQRAWVQRGSLRMNSRDVNTFLSGGGYLDLQGQWRVFAQGGGGGYALVRLPIWASTGSRIQVDGGAQLGFWNGGHLTGSAQLVVGGLMNFVADGSARELTLLAGSRLEGGGTLLVSGSNRLVVHDQLDVATAVALIDSSEATGSGSLEFKQSQTLARVWNLPVTVAASVAVGSDGAVFNAPVLVQPDATFWVNNNQVLTINGTLTNRGTVRMNSRDVNSVLSGTGRVHNEGLFRVTPQGGGGGSARWHMPITQASTGRIQIDGGAQVLLRPGGALDLDGLLNIDGYLAVDAADPALEVRLNSGGGITGDGTLRFRGTSRLMMNAPATVAANLEMFESSRVEGPGLLTLADDQNLTGRYLAPVLLAPGANVGFSEPIFSGPLTLAATATGRINGNQRLTIDGAFTNRGTLLMISRDVNTWLQGTGVVHNAGLLRVLQQGGGGGNARIQVPVVTEAGGTMLLDGGTQTLLSTGGRLEVHGPFQIDGYLAIEGVSPGLEVALESGGILTGGGTIRFHGPSRLLMNAPATVSANLEMFDSSRVEGTGLLTLTHEQTLTGQYFAPVLLAPGASVAFSDPTFTGPLTLAETALGRINGNRTLTLDGTFTNRGTMLMISRDVNTSLRGTGLVHNAGLLRVVQQGGGGAYARIHVPVVTEAGGTMLLDGGTQTILSSGSRLEVRGPVQIDGYLAIDAVSPGLEVALESGGTLTGNGTIRFHGPSRLLMNAPATVSANLEMFDPSRVEGIGLLTLTDDQTLTGRYLAPVLLAPGANVGFADPIFKGPLTLAATATGVIHGNRTFTLDGAFTNRGTMLMISRDVNTWMQGTGRVHNAGLLRVYPQGGGGGYARIHVPVITEAGGTILLDGASHTWLGGGGRLEVRGPVQIEGYFAIEGASPGLEVALESDGTLTGTGTIRFHGPSRLVMNAAASVSAHLQMFDASRVEGTGLLTLLNDQNLTGQYLAPVLLASGSSVGFSSPTFLNQLTLDSGAAAIVSGNQSLIVNGSLTNHGILRMISRDVNTTISGTGSFVNHGQFHVYPQGGGGGWARVHLPLTTSASGQTQVDGGARLGFGEGGTFTLAGTAHIDGGGLIQFWNAGPPRDLTLLTGAQWTGAGQIDFLGSNRLVVTGNATLAGGLMNLAQSSTMDGTGTLTVLAGATLLWDHAVTFPGSIVLHGTLHAVSGTSRIAGTLTLQPGGLLRNPVALEVGAYVDQVGTVEGALPIVIGFGPGSVDFRIDSIAFQDPLSGVRRAAALTVVTGPVVIECRGPEGRNLLLEESSDLQRWLPVEAIVVEVTPGHYRARVESTDPTESPLRFFRVRTR